MPGKKELGLLLVLAILATAIVAAAEVRDLTFSALSIPIFIVGAVLGMRRNGQLAAPPKPAEQESKTP